MPWRCNNNCSESLILTLQRWFLYSFCFFVVIFFFCFVFVSLMEEGLNGVCWRALMCVRECVCVSSEHNPRQGAFELNIWECACECSLINCDKIVIKISSSSSRQQRAENSLHLNKFRAGTFCSKIQRPFFFGNIFMQISKSQRCISFLFIIMLRAAKWLMMRAGCCSKFFRIFLFSFFSLLSNKNHFTSSCQNCTLTWENNK